MTDKELLERLKRMYINESANLRRAKLDKEKAAARRAVEVLGEVIDWIERERMPNTELVEVVRCADCKWFNPINNGDHGYCGTPFHGAEVYEDDYCSDGERVKDGM